MIGKTYCELCSKDIRNHEWRKHIISAKQLQLEDKFFCDLCKHKHSLRVYIGSVKDKFRDAEYNHRIYPPVICFCDDITQKINQDRIEIYSSEIFEYFFTIKQLNNFTSDIAAKSENLTSNSILRFYKQNRMLKFMEIKSNEPKLSQKEISKH